MMLLPAAQNQRPANEGARVRRRRDCAGNLSGLCRGPGLTNVEMQRLDKELPIPRYGLAWQNANRV